MNRVALWLLVVIVVAVCGSYVALVCGRALPTEHTTCQDVQAAVVAYVKLVYRN